jgi:hypothetical protein
MFRKRLMVVEAAAIEHLAAGQAWRGWCHFP